MERTRPLSEVTRIERPKTPRPVPEPASQALLVNVSVDRGELWDWHRISTMSPPLEPVRLSEYEASARAVLRAYRPGLLARITGAARRRRTELERAAAQAANADVLRYSAAVAAHRAAHHEWSVAMSLAPGVLRLDETACRAALRFARAFRDLPKLCSNVTLDSVRNRVATLTCVIDDPDRLPLPARPRAASTRIGVPSPLADDHICSLAIRIAREAFAVLPIASVVVNITTERIDPTTGRLVVDTILGTRFSLQAISRLHTLDETRTAEGSMPPFSDLPSDDPWDEKTPVDWDADTVKPKLVR